LLAINPEVFSDQTDAPMLFMDHSRAHSSQLLDLLVKHNFQHLCTDFTGFQSKCTHKSMIHEASDFYMKLFVGEHALADHMRWCNEGLLLVDVEDCAVRLHMLRILQENMLELHSLNAHFRIGIVMYLNFLPLGTPKDGEPRVDLDLCMQTCANPLLDPHRWPFIDEVIVLDTAHPVQFGAMLTDGLTRTVTRLKHVAVAVCTHNNSKATALLKAYSAHAPAVDVNSNPYLHKSGAHMIHPGPVPDTRLQTWLMLHCPSPRFIMSGYPLSSTTSTMAMSLDSIIIPPESLFSGQAPTPVTVPFILDVDSSQVEILMVLVKHHTATSVTVDVPCLLPRPSFGSFICNRRFTVDLLVTVQASTLNTAKSAAVGVMKSLIQHLNAVEVLYGFPDLVHIDATYETGSRALILFVSSNTVLHMLSRQGIIAQCVFIMPLCAVVTKPKAQSDPDLLCSPSGLAAFCGTIHAFNAAMASCPRTKSYRVTEIRTSMHPEVHKPLVDSGMFVIERGSIIQLKSIPHAQAGAPNTQQGSMSNAAHVQVQSSVGTVQPAVVQGDTVHGAPATAQPHSTVHAQVKAPPHVPVQEAAVQGAPVHVQVKAPPHVPVQAAAVQGVPVHVQVKAPPHVPIQSAAVQGAHVTAQPHSTVHVQVKAHPNQADGHGALAQGVHANTHSAQDTGVNRGTQITHHPAEMTHLKRSVAPKTCFDDDIVVPKPPPPKACPSNAHTPQVKAPPAEAVFMPSPHASLPVTTCDAPAAPYGLQSKASPSSCTSGVAGVPHTGNHAAAVDGVQHDQLGYSASVHLPITMEAISKHDSLTGSVQPLRRSDSVSTLVPQPLKHRVESVIYTGPEASANTWLCVKLNLPGDHPGGTAFDFTHHFQAITEQIQRLYGNGRTITTRPSGTMSMFFLHTDFQMANWFLHLMLIMDYMYHTSHFTCVCHFTVHNGSTQ